MDLDLKGKRALITGSTRGIGLASARELATMGAEVILNGRSKDKVDEAVRGIIEKLPTAIVTGVVADLGTKEGCAELTAQIPDVDILVNNMGIYNPKPFDDISDEEWEEMFYVNVMSGVRLSRHYFKRLLKKDWGRIVFVSSESGICIPSEMVHYGFSKAAQLAISRGMAELTTGTGVTVNSVLPGPTWVEANVERMETRAKEQETTVDALKEALFTVRRPSSLLQRFATPQEVANMIAYVCSPASAATNGAALRVEGGIVRNPF